MDMKIFREQRQRSGLSQGDIAELTGVHRVTINRLERGHHQPRPLTLNVLEKLVSLIEKEVDGTAKSKKGDEI